MKVINDILDNIDGQYKKSISIVNYNGNITKFLNIFKSCSIIIGTRFHSVILALLFGKKVFPIIYSDKTYNILKDLNIDNEYCYIRDIKNLDEEKVISKASANVIKNKDIIVKAKDHFRKLDEYLKI